jgi:nucleotide-binding universal stress UspA family protein
LDGSKESEGVFSAVRDELAPDAEVVLVQVIPPGKTHVVGNQLLLSSQWEDAERSKAEAYLKGVIRQLSGDSDRWRYHVAIAESVSDGIVDTARQNDVDLIAMYTHDRKGLAALVKKSIARDVQKKAPIEVKVFKPAQLVGVA